MSSIPAPSRDAAGGLTDTEWDSVFSEDLDKGFNNDFDPARETREILDDPVWVELLEEAERDLAAGKGRAHAEGGGVLILGR